MRIARRIKESMKKDDRILLWIYVAIGVVVAGVTGWFLYQDRQEFWHTQARGAFGIALTEELQKWEAFDVYVNSTGNRKLPKNPIDQKQELVKVSMETGWGKMDYWIPSEKFAYNIGASDDERGMHSYLLHVSPLNADSLNLRWKNRLDMTGLTGTTVVRIAVTDWWEHESYTCSADSFDVSTSDSLATYYLGYRCEVGVTGYLYHPWWKLFAWKDWGLLATLIVFAILLFFMQEYVNKACRYLFVKEKLVVIEKEVPAIIGHKSHLSVYSLEEGVCFDADSRRLESGDAFVKLTPLSAKLLQGFLDAEEYRLTNDEILQLLWPDGSGTLDKLYQNIKRLRDCLSQVSGCTLANENFAYRLIIPHSIEKKLI